METSNFYVKRNNLKETCFNHSHHAADIQDGQVLLKVDRFAFTANNITYAAMGDAMRYWEFFPTEEEMGNIPVWGFADVVASECEQITVGERLYGYYPMSSHLVVEPKNITANNFVDGTQHRQSLSVIYNQYLRSTQDPLYTAESESLQMLLRPLFTTSFLLDDFFADNGFFGADTLVLTSASSKTALGMAFLLNQKRQDRQQDYEIVGLTSLANLEFVKGLGCYDRVLSYDQVADLDNSRATATVDFAGNGELLGQLHTLLNEQLKYSCLVGVSHWDQRDGLPSVLPGPTPEMFFAPSQAEKRIQEWGGARFQKRLAEAWSLFTRFAGNWIEVEYGLGPEAVERVYQDTLAGRMNPKAGHILSLWSDQCT